MIEPVDLTVGLYEDENVTGKIQAKLNELIAAHNHLEAEYQRYQGHSHKHHHYVGRDMNVTNDN